MTISNFILVAAGGAAGSVLRYGMGLLIGKHLFPLTTFVVNIAGCFLIGLLYGWLTRQVITDKQVLLLATGLCGGFTTFSAFGMESLSLLQQQQFVLMAGYIALSVSLGIAATAAGYSLAK